jgi:hypothetical protein
MQHAARRDISAILCCCWATDQHPSCNCTSLRLRVQLRRLAQLALAQMVLVPLAQPQPVLAHAHPLPQHRPLSHRVQRPHKLLYPLESLAQLALSKMVQFPLAQPQPVLAHADPFPEHRPLSQRVQLLPFHQANPLEISTAQTPLLMPTLHLRAQRPHARPLALAWALAYHRWRILVLLVAGAAEVHTSAQHVADSQLQWKEPQLHCPNPAMGTSCKYFPML